MTEPCSLRLSACLIVKDEAANLPRCLASLAGFVDEIVVVDTGSTDDTVAIAEAAGCKVGHFAWCDDFSAARNAAIELATGDWILVIDADEELLVDDPAALRALMADAAAVYLVPLHDVVTGRAEGAAGQVVRLFPRLDDLRFHGRLHEGLGLAMAPLGLQLLETAALHLVHHGYRPEVLAGRGKGERNLRIARLEAEERPDHPHALFQLARSAVAGNHLEEGLAAWERLRAIAASDPARDAYMPNYLAVLAEMFAERVKALGEACERLASPPVTACMIVKNEEAQLPRSLASLRGLVEALVVVDTGSTDRTVEIARRAGARVAHFDWCDDFSAARNASLALAEGGWALVLDADEELVVDDPTAFRRALADASVGAYVIEIENVDAEGRVESRLVPAPRLFRLAPGVRFEGRLHEDVSASLRARGWTGERLPGVRIRHHGYTARMFAERDKVARNRRIAALAAEERPFDPNAWHDVAAMAWVERDAAATLAAVERCLMLQAQGHALPRHRQTTVRWLEAMSCDALGDRARAMAALDAGLAAHPGHPELAYERGTRRADAGDAAAAIADLEACLAAAGRPYEGTLRAGVTGYLPRTELGAIHARAGRRDEAIRHLQAAQADPACPPAEAGRLAALIASLQASAATPAVPGRVEAGRQAELVARLERQPRDAAAFLELALICFQAGEADKALVAIDQSISLDASSPSAFHLLGLVLADLGQPEWAGKAFATVLQLDPEHPKALDARLEVRQRKATTEASPELAARLERLLALAFPRLSACLIVKDEAANLPRCLASLSGFVDEIVVVDTGSTDDTVAIAEAAGAKVGHFAWCDDFSAARNAAIELATGDWILVIDADEELVVDHPEAFRRLLRGRVPAGFILDQVNVDAAGRPDQVAPVLRLFQANPALRFTGRIHETVEEGVRALDWPVMACDIVRLRHTGYVPTAVASRGKPERNARLAALAAEEAPTAAHHWLALATARFEAGDLTGAREAFAALDARAGGLAALGGARREHAVLQRAALERAAGHAQAAEALLAEGLARVPGYPEFHYERGQLRAARGDVAGARADFEACLRADRGAWSHLPLRVGVTGTLPRAALAALPANVPAPAVVAPAPAPAAPAAASRKGELVTRLERQPRDAAAFLELGLICFQAGEADKALVAVDQAISLDATSPSCFYMLGLVLADLGQPGWAGKAFAMALQLDPEHPTALKARLDMRGRTAEGEAPPTLVERLERLLAAAHPRVSACLIVKDEAANLPRCLASLSGFVDEIVVVDTGSTDDTVAIAEAAGCKVGHFAWCDDFSAARNAAIELATGDWILVIDADEELVVDDEPTYRVALRNRVPAAYVTTLVDRLDDRMTIDSSVCRLFQRLDGVRYAGRIHESVGEGLAALGWPVEPLDALHFIHHGNQARAVAEHDKLNRNLHLARLDAEERPDDVRAWFTAATTYRRAGQLADARTALEHIAASPALAGLDDGRFVQYATLGADVYGQLGDAARAEALLDAALARVPGFPELLYERGRLRAGRGEVDGARADFEACLAAAGREWPKLVMRPDVVDALPRAALAELAHTPPAPVAERGRRGELLDRLRAHPRDAAAFLELGLICFQAGETDRALVAVDQAIALDASSPSAFYLLGLVLAELGEPFWAGKAFATVLQLDPEHPKALEARLEMRGRAAAAEAAPELVTRLERLLAMAFPRLSACLIVKNEAENLPRCLASLSGFVDEIVVVDTGSTDDTVAIAEAAGCKVGHFAWCDDFSAARNAAIELATGDWILVIDADEELVVDDPEVLRRALRNRTPAGYVTNLANIGPDGNVDSISPMLRLFQATPALRYHGRLHESLNEGVRALGWPLEPLFGVSFRHHGYHMAVVMDRAKGARNVRLAELDVEERPTSVEAWLNLARSRAMAGDPDGALDAFEKLATEPGWLDGLTEPLFAIYIITYQELLRQAGRFAAAEHVLNVGLARLVDFPDFLFERGNVRYRLDRIAEARADFETCLKPAKRDYVMHFRAGVTDELPRLALAQIDAQAGVRPRVLSACLIVKDEEANLPRCLASLRGLVDEIVVVDTGSTDRTVAVAMAAGARVSFFPWRNDFAAARNASLEQATGDWVLVIDADEELVVEDREAFRTALDDAKVGGYIFPIRNLRDDGSFQLQPMLRLFRRHPQVRFSGRLHEEVTREIEALGWKVGILEDVYIRHHGYLSAAIEARGKWTRNLQIAIAEVEARPDSPLAWYNLGRSSLFTGQTDPARDAFGQVERLLAEGASMGEAPYCNYVLLRRKLLVEEGRAAEAEALLDAALARVPGYPEFHYERGLLRAERGDVAGARADFEACLVPGDRFYTAAIRDGVRDAWPRRELARLAVAAPDAGGI